MNTTNYPGYVTLKCKVHRAIWNITCFLLFRPFPTSLFWPWRLLILRLFGAKVSSKAYVYSSVRIWAPWLLRLDAGAKLGPEVICYNQAPVWLKAGCVVSQYSHLCTAGHETDRPNSDTEGLITAAITLHENSWIGTQAFIGMGVEVGHDAIVGARAAVFRDVEPLTIVGGNPARELKKKGVGEDVIS